MDKLICIIGKSGSGKSTIAEIASEFGHTTLPSYTTRPKRSEDEMGHEFVSESEFEQLDDLVAYNNFNGFDYGATREQVEKHDIYIVDLVGLNELIENIGRDKIVTVRVDANYGVRLERMIESRGVESATSRILYDESEFAELGDHEFDYVFENNDMMDLAYNAAQLDYIISSIKYHGDVE